MEKVAVGHAAVLVIVGNAVDLSEGVAQASTSLDSGRAAEVLDELVRVSAISALDTEVG